MSFFERLTIRCKEVDSFLCVGLDPHTQDLEKLGDVSAEGAYKFAINLIDQTKHIAVCYKPNAAFFEALGAEGVNALARVIAYVPDAIPVLLDNKRGDIGSTAVAYAESAYSHYKADAVTVNPYMGTDSVAPFTSDPTKGAFVLCKTSNPSSSELQELYLSTGEAVFERTAKLASDLWNGNNNVGLVVGATDVDALERSRRAAPGLWILAPGIGSQGGDLVQATAKGLRKDGYGLLVPVSRGIARAENPKEAAEKLREELNEARKSAMALMAAEEAKTESVASSSVTVELKPFQTKFIQFALDATVLRFGEFTLKSGRTSPYFFNAGLFNSGQLLMETGEAYASALLERPDVEYDVLFGPAYKGITLVSGLSIALARRGVNKDFAYNRKEKKDHGEGGVLVGASVEGKRVLIVDDVITAGTAIREAITLLKAAGAIIAGVVIALDRAEIVSEEKPISAIQSVQKEYGLPIVNIIALNHLLTYVSKNEQHKNMLPAVEAYRDTYGTKV